MVSRLCAALVLLLFSGVLAAEQPHFYQVDMELWIDGQERGAPTMVIQAGTSGSIEVGGQESGWRIELHVEKPDPAEGAPDGAVWMHIVVHERQDGELEELVDTIMGVPAGRPAALSVVEDQVVDPRPETSLVYLVARLTRLEELPE